jgi:hypothetical protein
MSCLHNVLGGIRFQQLDAKEKGKESQVSKLLLHFHLLTFSKKNMLNEANNA